jgi:hypothetical protein
MPNRTPIFFIAASSDFETGVLDPALATQSRLGDTRLGVAPKF